MSVSINLDISKAIANLTDVEQRQIPFAFARSINMTATFFQDKMRAGIAARFMLRQPGFILNSVKIERGNWATSKGFSEGGGKFTATVSMGGEGSSHKNSGILVKYEEGGERTASDPFVPLAIPTKALRASFAELAPQNMYPKNLRLVPRRGVDGIVPANVHVTRRGIPQIQGKRRTFVLDPSTNIGSNVYGVFQRFGPRRSDIQLIWRYKMRVKIPPRLQFRQTAQEEVPGQFVENFKLMLAVARQTAR